MKTKALIKLLVSSLFAMMIMSGCSGKNGSTGTAGTTGVTGPTGPVSPAPVITGLDPTMSSFNTVITITGENFTASPTVYCDGSPAMLMSYSATQITVTGCGQVNLASLYQAAVNVLVGKQMSNPVNENIVPSGYVMQFPAASLTGPQGEVYDGTTGKVYVADNAGIFAVDNATGWTTQVVPAGCPTCALSTPAGITMDNSGNLIVTDSGNSTLVGVNPTTGATWYVLGPGNGLLSTPIGVTYSNGDLYVANSGSSNVTQINDTTLSAVNLSLNVGLASAPFGITADALGNLYVACPATDIIDKIVITGGNSGTVTDSGITGLSAPYGISISGTTMLVTSNSNQTLYSASVGGAASTMCADFSPWETNANSSIIPDGAGGIFVGDVNDAVVYQVSSACDTSTYAQGFAYPYDVAYTNGDIYAVNDWFSEPYGDSIFEIRPDGAMRVLAQIEGYGESVIANPTGNVTVGSYDGSVINVSSTGVTSTVFPLGTFINGVTGLAYDNSGNLFINNYGTIAKWDGTTLNSSFATGTNRYQIAYHNGYIYISDFDNGSVDRVNATTGGPVSVYVSSLTGGFGTHSLEGIGFDTYGNILLADYRNNGLYRVDPQAHVTALVPPATSPMSHPNGIAIPPSQLIYTVEEHSPGVAKMWVIAP